MTETTRAPGLTRKQKNKIKGLILHIVLILASIGFTFPFLWM